MKTFFSCICVYNYAVIIFLCVVIPQFDSFAQGVDLAPFIGTEILPTDDEGICDIPVYPEVDVELEGMTEGDLIPDFQLHTVEGGVYKASNILADGKPALFISCSYTCPVFRDKINDINNLQIMYGDVVNIFLIYTIEAHPKIDVSAYYGYVNTGPDNYDDGILYRQPTTYGERKNIVQDMLADYEINVPVLLDGTCNPWWENFGTNPNCSWLVTSEGIVFDAAQWFNRYPNNIEDEIESLLNGEPGGGGGDADGYFVVEEVSADCFEGIAGETIAAEITVTNTDDVDAYIDILKTGEILPAAWETSICTDVCYSPSVDSANLFIPAGETIVVHLYFYTNEIEGEGTSNLLFRNHYYPENNYPVTVKACASAATAATDIATQTIQIFPNPVNDFLFISFSNVVDENNTITIADISGKKLFDNSFRVTTENLKIDVSEYPSGIYFIQMRNGNKTETLKFVIQ